MIIPLLAHGQPALPVPPNRLVGRAQDLDAIQAMLGEPQTRLVTLTGPGGVGKTHTAMQIATQSASRFPGGVVFVFLSSIREPDLVIPTIAQTLGLREAHGQVLLDVLANALTDKDMLIVLDNLEQVMEAIPDIGVLIAATERPRFLATSRSPMRLRVEREFPVHPLPLPAQETAITVDALSENAAVTLFVERAKAARPSFAFTDANAATIAEICRRLDGLPLAIELAAAMTPILPPAALLSRMERRLPLLVHGAADLPDRQRTLSGAIGWSYDLLDSNEQALFRRLGVFASGATIDAIDSVADGIDTLGTISSLVNKSLLLREEDYELPNTPDDEPRFRMLATIREFAAERLREHADADTAHQRLLQWLLARGAEAEEALTGPEQVQWLVRLDQEHDNIRAMLAWSLDHAPREGTLLASMLWRYWATRGQLTEGHTWLRRFLGSPGPYDDAVRAKAFGGLGNLCIDIGDYPAATEAYLSALELWERLGDARGIANTQNGIGLVDWYRGDNDAAKARHTTALELRRKIGDRFGQANSLTNLGNAIKDAGDATGSRVYHEQALAIRQELGDRAGVGYSYLNLGDIGRRLGDAGNARQMFRKSLDAFRDVGDRLGLGYALQGLGMAEQLGGNSQAAAEHFLEALSIRSGLGDRRGVVECIEGIALVLTAGRRHADAVTLFGAAEALRAQIGAPRPTPDERVFTPAIESSRRALTPGDATSRWEVGAHLSLADATTMAKDTVSGLSIQVSEPAGILSEREVEVVHLVASGMTNAEVAEKLFLSRRTVDAHLRRIYDKLDLSSRAEVIRYAMESGIA